MLAPIVYNAVALTELVTKVSQVTVIVVPAIQAGQGKIVVSALRGISVHPASNATAIHLAAPARTD